MDKKFLDSSGLTYFINKIVYGITSPKFSTGSTYAVGNFVIYTGKLYRCTTAVTVAGAWSASAWTATTVSAELASSRQSVATMNSNLNGLAFEQGTDGKWGYKVAGADPVIPFSSYEGYTLPTLYLLSTYTSTNPLTIAGSQVWIPLTNAKGISLTYVAQNYNDITANLVDNDGNTIPAFGHSGRGGYSGSYTNNSLNKNYKWMSISVSANGASTNTATVSNIHVTT